MNILQGDWIERLRTLPGESVQCCVTSPPYWGLRDYGVNGQLGLEKTPHEYVEKIVAGFREVRRVLKNDGTLWLNLGDSYAARLRQSGPEHAGNLTNSSRGVLTKIVRDRPDDLKEKDLVGIPWLVAFALRADGWWLRSDIIWHKSNPMPESVTDRPTKAHEYLFLMSKSAKYFYDAEAIKTPPSEVYANDSRWDSGGSDVNYKNGYADAMAQNPKMPHRVFNGDKPSGINKRSVWTVATAPYPEAHFATFPPDLIKPCILAGTKPGDTVLDPFLGSGTTGMVALELGRKCIGIELSEKYIELARRRCDVTQGLAL